MHNIQRETMVQTSKELIQPARRSRVGGTDLKFGKSAVNEHAVPLNILRLCQMHYAILLWGSH